MTALISIRATSKWIRLQDVGKWIFRKVSKVFAENLVSLSDFSFFFLLIVYYLDLRGSREESSSLVARVANVEAGPVALEAVEEEIEADFAWPLEADLLGGKGGADSATALAQNNKHHQP